MADRSIPTSAACPELRRVTRNGAPLPFPPPPSPVTRGDAFPATHSDAASVRASLVTAAACMGQQHPVESSLGPNLGATPRKQRGPLKIFASSELKLSYKLTPRPPCTHGDAQLARHSVAAPVRASLVIGAACMGLPHPVQSSLNPNLTLALRKRRGPLEFLASSEPTCPTK